MTGLATVPCMHLSACLIELIGLRDMLSQLSRQPQSPSEHTSDNACGSMRSCQSCLSLSVPRP